MDYAVASESVAIDALDHYNTFTLERDVRAGEAIFVSNSGQIYTRQLHAGSSSFTPCIFEYVYFARPDSVRNIYFMFGLGFDDNYCSTDFGWSACVRCARSHG